MRCPNCGTENADSDNRCSHCSELLDPEVTIQVLPGLQQPEAPKQIIQGRFEVISILGKGGMGAVYHARDRKMGGREVAVKQMLSLDEQSMTRFKTEVEAIASLSHQNIRMVYEFVDSGDEPLMVMEYIDGETLKGRVNSGGPLEDDKLCSIAQGLAKALDYMHRHKVYHRDVKPANVLLDRYDTPKLTDFGLARVGADASELSQSGFGMGTLDYASPEQRKDAKNVDHRSDIYAFGATLYFCCTGQSPRVIRESLIPVRWKSLILKCLEERSEDRYFSMSELITELDAIKGASSSVTRVSTSDAIVCAHCHAPNNPKARFCRQCRAGLYIRCPECDSDERDDGQFCGACGFDIPAWKNYEEHMRTARLGLEKHDYVEAAKEARSANSALPDREEAAELLAQIEELKSQTRQIRKTAQEHQQAGRWAEAAAEWARLVGLAPDDSFATRSLSECRQAARKAKFDKNLETLRAMIARADLDKASAGIKKVADKFTEPAEAEALDELRQVFDQAQSSAKVLALRRFEEALIRPDGGEEAAQALEEIRTHGVGDHELRRLEARLEDHQARQALNAAQVKQDWRGTLRQLERMRPLDLGLDAAADKARTAALAQDTLQLFHASLRAAHFDVAESALRLLAAFGQGKNQLDPLRKVLRRRRGGRRVRRMVTMLLLLVLLLAGGGGGGAFYVLDHNRKTLNLVLGRVLDGQQATLADSGYWDHELIPAEARPWLWPSMGPLDEVIGQLSDLPSLSTSDLLGVEGQLGRLSGIGGIETNVDRIHAKVEREVTERLLRFAPRQLWADGALLTAWGGQPVARLELSQGTRNVQDLRAEAGTGAFPLGNLSPADLAEMDAMVLHDPHGYRVRVELDPPVVEGLPATGSWGPIAYSPEAARLLRQDLQAARSPVGLGEFTRRLLEGGLAAWRALPPPSEDSADDPKQALAQELVALAVMAIDKGRLDAEGDLNQRVQDTIDQQWGDFPAALRDDYQVLSADSDQVSDEDRRYPRLLRHLPSGLVLTYVRGGFIEDAEGVQRWVPGFYVTRELVSAGSEAGQAGNGSLSGGDDADAVRAATWREAQARGEALGLELPTLAQWRRAAGPEATRTDPSWCGVAALGARQWCRVDSFEPQPAPEGDQASDAGEQALGPGEQASDLGDQSAQPEAGTEGDPAGLPSSDQDRPEPAGTDAGAEALADGNPNPTPDLLADEAAGYLRWSADDESSLDRPALHLVLRLDDQEPSALVHLLLQSEAAPTSEPWETWVSDPGLVASFLPAVLAVHVSAVDVSFAPADGSGAPVELSVSGFEQGFVKVRPEDLGDGRWVVQANLVDRNQERTPFLFLNAAEDETPSPRHELWVDREPPGLELLSSGKSQQDVLSLELRALDETSGVAEVTLQLAESTVPLESSGEGLYSASYPSESAEVRQTGMLKVMDRAGLSEERSVTFEKDTRQVSVSKLALVLDGPYLQDLQTGRWLLPRGTDEHPVRLVGEYIVRQGQLVTVAGSEVPLAATEGGLDVPVTLAPPGDTIEVAVSGKVMATLDYELVAPPRLVLGEWERFVNVPKPPDPLVVTVSGGVGGSLEVVSSVDGDVVTTSEGGRYPAGPGTAVDVGLVFDKDRQGPRQLTLEVSDDLGQVSGATVEVAYDSTNPGIVEHGLERGNPAEGGNTCIQHLHPDDSDTTYNCHWDVIDQDIGIIQVKLDEPLEKATRDGTPITLTVGKDGFVLNLAPEEVESEVELDLFDRAANETRRRLHTGAARRQPLLVTASGRPASSLALPLNGSVCAVVPGSSGGKTFGTLLRYPRGSDSPSQTPIPAVVVGGVFGSTSTSVAILGADGTSVAYAGGEGDVQLRDLALSEQGPTINRDDSGTVRLAALSNSGSHLVTASDKGDIRLFDSEPDSKRENRLLRSFKTLSPSVVDVSCSDQQGRVAVLDEGSLYTAQVLPGQPRDQAPTRTVLEGGRALAISPDGRFLLVMLASKVRLFRWGSFEEYSATWFASSEGSAPPASMAFDPDSRYALVGSQAGDVAVVAVDPDASDLIQVGFLRHVSKGELQSPVRRLVVSPDGRRAAAGFEDGTIQAWALPRSFFLPGQD